MCENSLSTAFGGYLVNLMDRNSLILLMLNFQNRQENLIWAGFAEFSHSQDPLRTFPVLDKRPNSPTVDNTVPPIW